jgi:predicted secreted Zn-dependent protease
MNFSNRALALIITVLLICCCFTGAVWALVLVSMPDSPISIAAFLPTNTPTRTPTATFTPTRPRPTETRTPAPTNTRVIPLGPTLAPTRTPTGARTSLPTRPAQTLGSNPYAIIVATPTAPAIINPVDFNSTFKVVTYTVTGKTANELSRSLDAQAISDPHEPRSKYYALVEWYVGYDPPQLKQTARGCELDRANVTIVLTMTLPALTTRQGIASDVLSRWDTFLANTITHEKGHVTRALDGVRNLQRDFGNLPPQSDCRMMDIRIRDVFKKNFDQIDRVNVQYDDETDHGVTQGAVFP